MGTLTFSSFVIKFILLAIAVVGIALFYQTIQKPGQILHWWRKVFTIWIPKLRSEVKKFLANTGEIINVLFDDEYIKLVRRSIKKGKILNLVLNLLWCIWYYMIVAPLALIISVPVAVIMYIVLSILWWIRKPLVTCLHCNVFWLALLVYWVAFGKMWANFIIFFGLVYITFIIDARYDVTD